MIFNLSPSSAVFMANLLDSGKAIKDSDGILKKESIGFSDIYTIVFVISTFPVEIAQVS